MTADLLWSGALAGYGAAYFFLRGSFAGSSPVPSHKEQTFPSLRPVPRQTEHRTDPASLEFGMWESNFSVTAVFSLCQRVALTLRATRD
jgi:hypothetical protein